MTTEVNEQPVGVERVPWYTLNPKHLRFSKGVWILLLITALFAVGSSISVKPVWQYGWRHGWYSRANFQPQKTATGGTVPGGAWARSKTIHVYGLPGVRAKSVELATQGLQSLVTELGLAITVQQVPMPTDAQKSYDNALLRTSDGGAFDFDRFTDSRLALRGAQYGEMVVVDQHFADPSWAFGLSSFAPGISALQQSVISTSLARHEGAHLVGYGYHDDYPWYVIGYREALLPQSRNTLMMLNPTPSDALSDRARDALLNFWSDMEARDHTRYFR